MLQNVNISNILYQIGKNGFLMVSEFLLTFLIEPSKFVRGWFTIVNISIREA